MSSHPHNAIYIHDMAMQEGTRHSRLVIHTLPPQFWYYYFFALQLQSDALLFFVSIWARHELCFRSCSRGRACGDWGAFDVVDLFPFTRFLLIPFKQFVTELVSILNILSIKQRHHWMLMLSRLKWLLMYLLRCISFCSRPWSWRSVYFAALYPFLSRRLLGEGIIQSPQQNVWKLETAIL